MITLKSELARHLVTEEPERCAQELSEMERVARQTLREVREMVAGYRPPRLESELDGARQLLEAARSDNANCNEIATFLQDHGNTPMLPLSQERKKLHHRMNQCKKYTTGGYYS